MDLQERIRRLEDIEAVKQLKYRYCLACDDDYDADAVWDGGAMERYQGREAIRAFFAGASKLVPFAMPRATRRSGWVGATTIATGAKETGGCSRR